MNTIVNFELAKLIKEKGFDKEVIHQWGLKYDWDKKELVGNPYLTKKESDNYNSNRFIQNCSYSAPTIAEVLCWIYNTHKIWIYIRPVLDEDGEWIFKGYVKTMNNFKAKEFQTKILRQPTEAYESAIEHTLKELI